MQQRYEGELTWGDCFRWSSDTMFLWMTLRQSLFFAGMAVVSTDAPLSVLITPLFFLIMHVATIAFMLFRFRKRRITVEVSESGLRIEHAGLPKRVDQCDWQQLAQNRLFRALRTSEDLFLPMVNARGQQAYFPMPKRIFGSPLEAHAVSQFIEQQVAQSCTSNGVSVDPAGFEWICSPERGFPARLVAERCRDWSLCVSRAMCLCLLIFGMQNVTQSTGSVIMQILSGCATFAAGMMLLFPERWLARLLTFGLSDDGFWRRITVNADGITEQRRPVNAYEPIQWPVVLPWSSLAASGVCEESADGFLLEYPRRKGRKPSRACWLPKAALDEASQTDEFRQLVREKMGDAMTLEHAAYNGAT